MKNEKQSAPVTVSQIEQLLERGNQAWYHYRVQDALHAWQRGLELADRLPQEHAMAGAHLCCQLWSRVIEVWLARGLISQASEAVENMESQAEVCACAHPELSVLVQMWRARVARSQRDMDRAQKRIYEALRLAQRLPSDEVRQRILAMVHLERGIVALETSENHTAMDAFVQARSLYRQLGDRLGEAHSVMTMGRLYSRMDMPEQAITHYEEADAVFRHVPHDPTIEYIHQLAWGSSLRAAADAIVRYQSALDLARQLGSDPYVAHCLNNVGVTLQQQGEAEKALELYEEALELYQGMNDRFGIVISLHNVGEIYLDLRRADEALSALKEVIKTAKSINYRTILPETYRLLSAAHLMLDQSFKAFNYAEKAVHLAEEVGHLPYAGMAYRALGIAAAALERQGRLPPVVPAEGPEAYFATSMEILSGLNNTYERARTLLAWGRYLSESGEPTRQAKGDSYLKRAGEQFDYLQLPEPRVL